MVRSIYLGSQNSELGRTAHASCPCSICKLENELVGSISLAHTHI